MICIDARERKTTNEHAEVSVLKLSPPHAEYLHQHAIQMAATGGPQIVGMRGTAEFHADRLREMLSSDQRAILDSYAENRITLLIFEGMFDFSDNDLPQELPTLDDLKHDVRCLALASRSQIILNLAGNRAFAYDLDYNEMVRIVGNFKGGGRERIKNEPLPESVELSSHSGLALGAHTEPPYYCSFNATKNHSPAPSTLILTARWNPKQEPTIIIPIAEVLQEIDPAAVIALTKKHYRFTRPNSYIAGDEDGIEVSILDYNSHGDYALRFSAYRFSACPDAPAISKHAIEALQAGIANAKQIKVVLNPSRSILINNTKALHCRDIIEDNRRILVRLFGYNRYSTALDKSTDPALVKG